MPTKRTYMQSGPAPKRTKTLTQEVAKLKKQVSQNKHELKYYDDVVTFSSASTYWENSFINKPDPNIVNSPITRTPLIGRKIYVHKIEYRYTLPSNAEALIYRCKKQVVNADTTDFPLGLDPEYHTALRYSEYLQDTTKQVATGVIDFKNAPRLVEFDNPANDPDSLYVITKGDIRWNSNGVGRNCSFRLWYHDG